jgi:ABC-2 type transport system permease protein
MPIFDQGYQHWTGKLSGHSWRWLTITRHGVRQGLKSRILRYVIFSAWVPALVLVVMLSLWGLLERKSTIASAFLELMNFLFPGVGGDPKHYRADIWRLSYGYFLKTELYFSMILILIVGPSLISQDLRFNALPLYFSRSLRRIDYFLGKLGVIVTFLALVMIVPSIVAYILGLLFSLDLSIIPDTFGILLSSVAYGLIISVSAGLLVLALSALSRNSRYVALMWIGVWLVSGIVSTVLQSADSQQRRYEYFSKISVPRPERNDNMNMTHDQFQTRRRAWNQARQTAMVEYNLAELNYSKTDWRPLVSYHADLSRLGQELLGTNGSWQRLSVLLPSQRARDQMIATYMGPEFPWYWSALVLLGVFGLSACILNLSIKSLDRLK